MNPINRLGQKVVCIIPLTDIMSYCPQIKEAPERGKIYTVAGFETHTYGPSIHLREVASVTCPCDLLKNAPWPIVAFRPVNERKTDISVFTKMLDRLSRKRRTDA